MPLPSLFASRHRPQSWSIWRATAYGAAIGALAGVFKTLGPFRATAGPLINRLAGGVVEIVLAALAFAVLCGGAAALRTWLVQRTDG